MNVKILILVLGLLFMNCKNVAPVLIKANNTNITYSGRVEEVTDAVLLIAPGAMATVHFSGQYCELFLKAAETPYNYVFLELDGKYLGRYKLEENPETPLKVEIPNTGIKEHVLKIGKESENFNGAVVFGGIKVERLLEPVKNTAVFIEFIGDSITCGAAADASVTPCDEGEYFDHENVYYSYGPSLARELKADYMLSSVSGYGIYRNWNDENIDEPTLPQVYENLWLNTDSTKKFDFKKRIPDVVSICLGTNDFSNGDGVKPRLPFDKENYIDNYIKFVKGVFKQYPNAQIVLLNSPMIIGEDNDALVSYLREIIASFDGTVAKPIQLFQFKKAYVNGCSSHPSVAEHQQMAKKLLPFFKNII